MKLKFLKIETPVILSIVAIVISIITLYFQFFNIQHAVYYTFLEPKNNSQKGIIEIPVIFKNSGNQTEFILSMDLLMEIEDGENFVYKRIAYLDDNIFPLVLSPNDSKKVSLIGDYEHYLKGSFDFSTEQSKYFPVTKLDSVLLFIDIIYITKKGMRSEEKRKIGYLSFSDDKKLERIDCAPIELKKLDFSNSVGLEEYSLLYETHHHNIIINLDDSVSVKENLDNIELIKFLLGDSLYSQSKLFSPVKIDL